MIAYKLSLAPARPKVIAYKLLPKILNSLSHSTVYLLGAACVLLPFALRSRALYDARMIPAYLIDMKQE